MTAMAAKPITGVDAAVICMAADHATEQCNMVPEPGTMIRVGYLRRVPDRIEPILLSVWPWMRVTWRTYIACRVPRKRMFGPPVYEPGQREVINTHVVYPLTYLEAFIRFLNPSGKQHLATIDRGLPYRPGDLIDLDNLPAATTLDPDF